MAAVSRQRSALPAPPGSPPPVASRADTDRAWYREHHPDHEAWYFASAAATGAEGGRFDLPEPEGTCYLAGDVETAVRECLGHVAAGRPLTAAAVALSSVTELTLTAKQRQKVVNTLDPAAAEIVTREMGTSTNYRRARKWAQHWRSGRHTGILYTPRFSTGPSPALAVFGDAGRAPKGAATGLTITATEALHLRPVATVSRRRAVVDQ